MTEWLGNCQEKFYQFAGRKVKKHGAEGNTALRQAQDRRVADRWQRAEDRLQTTEILLWERLSAAIRTTSTI